MLWLRLINFYSYVWHKIACWIHYIETHKGHNSGLHNDNVTEDKLSAPTDLLMTKGHFVKRLAQLLKLPGSHLHNFLQTSTGIWSIVTTYRGTKVCQHTTDKLQAYRGTLAYMLEQTVTVSDQSYDASQILLKERNFIKKQMPMPN